MGAVTDITHVTDVAAPSGAGRHQEESGEAEKADQ